MGGASEVAQVLDMIDKHTVCQQQHDSHNLPKYADGSDESLERLSSSAGRQRSDLQHIPDQKSRHISPPVLPGSQCYNKVV